LTHTGSTLGSPDGDAAPRRGAEDRRFAASARAQLEPYELGGPRQVDEARQSADARAAEQRAKAQQADDRADDHWQQVRSDWDRHIRRTRERIDAKKAAVDADLAERDAE